MLDCVDYASGAQLVVRTFVREWQSGRGGFYGTWRICPPSCCFLRYLIGELYTWKTVEVLATNLEGRRKRRCFCWKHQNSEYDDGNITCCVSSMLNRLAFSMTLYIMTA